MKTLLKVLKNQMDEFTAEAAKTTNKAAARRTRKLSMKIQTNLKLYRADSIK